MRESTGLGASNQFTRASQRTSVQGICEALRVNVQPAQSCASDRLFSIHQGTRSVAKYAVEFGMLAAESSWNEPALQSPL